MVLKMVYIITLPPPLSIGDIGHPYPGFSGIIYPGFSRDPRKHWPKNIFRPSQKCFGLFPGEVLTARKRRFHSFWTPPPFARDSSAARPRAESRQRRSCRPPQNPGRAICLSSTVRFLGRPLMNRMRASFTSARMPARSACVFEDTVPRLSAMNFRILFFGKGSDPSIEDPLYMIRMPADRSFYTIYTFFTAKTSRKPLLLSALASLGLARYESRAPLARRLRVFASLR